MFPPVTPYNPRMKNKALTLRLSVQRALLGEVTANLIAVTAGIKGTKISIRSYFNADATAADLESMSCVGTEVIADFPDSYEIEDEVRIVTTQDEMEMLEFWAFLRAKIE